MNKTILTLVLGAAACGSSTPTVIEDDRPLAHAWGAVSLIVTGPEANSDKRKVCLKEAHNAGLNLVANAPAQATLLLDNDGNRVTLATGDRPLGKWTAAAVCRVAIAYAIDMDKYVKVGKTEPQGCTDLGPVQGEDQGFAFFGVNPGSYEAALAALQFSARQRNANYVALDFARQIGLNFSISGRAYQCAGGTAAPPPGATSL